MTQECDGAIQVIRLILRTRDFTLESIWLPELYEVTCEICRKKKLFALQNI